MERPFAWALAAVSACGGHVDEAPQEPATEVGSACIPAQERLSGFDGFDEREVVIEDATDSSGLVCLANHFRGFVTKPASQCADRPAEVAVYRSCRCANAEGRTDDGGRYCACPGELPCTPLVAGIGPSDEISGSYCVKRGTAYDPATVCR